MDKNKSIRFFVDSVKKTMDENLPYARFNETLRNIEKLKDNYTDLVNENNKLKDSILEYKAIISGLNQEINRLREQLMLLEEVFNSLKLIVSVRDIRRRNFIWYNQNYRRILGYRHKQLQELNTKEAIHLYHPDDYRKIRERNKFIIDHNQESHSCHVRLKHVNGSWIRMRSDFIALKRGLDGKLLQAIEIFSEIEEEK